MIVKDNIKHIADIKLPDGLVIEFQDSHISRQKIEDREAFYENMIWIINMRDYMKGDEKVKRFELCLKPQKEGVYPEFEIYDTDYYIAIFEKNFFINMRKEVYFDTEYGIFKLIANIQKKYMLVEKLPTKAFLKIIECSKPTLEYKDQIVLYDCPDMYISFLNKKKGDHSIILEGKGCIKFSGFVFYPSTGKGLLRYIGFKFETFEIMGKERCWWSFHSKDKKEIIKKENTKDKCLNKYFAHSSSNEKIYSDNVYSKEYLDGKIYRRIEYWCNNCGYDYICRCANKNDPRLSKIIFTGVNGKIGRLESKLICLNCKEYYKNCSCIGGGKMKKDKFICLNCDRSYKECECFVNKKKIQKEKSKFQYKEDPKKRIIFTETQVSGKILYWNLNSRVVADRATEKICGMMSEKNELISLTKNAEKWCIDRGLKIDYDFANYSSSENESE